MQSGKGSCLENSRADALRWAAISAQWRALRDCRQHCCTVPFPSVQPKARAVESAGTGEPKRAAERMLAEESHQRSGAHGTPLATAEEGESFCYSEFP